MVNVTNNGKNYLSLTIGTDRPVYIAPGSTVGLEDEDIEKGVALVRAQSCGPDVLANQLPGERGGPIAGGQGQQE